MSVAITIFVIMAMINQYKKLSSCVPWTGMVWVTTEKTLIIIRKEQTKDMLYQPAQTDNGHYWHCKLS